MLKFFAGVIFLIVAFKIVRDIVIEKIVRR